MVGNGVCVGLEKAEGAWNRLRSAHTIHCVGVRLLPPY